MGTATCLMMMKWWWLVVGSESENSSVCTESLCTLYDYLFSADVVLSFVLAMDAFDK